MSGWQATDIRSMELLFSAGTSTGLSDSELLDRFMSHAGAESELAFEILVLRHGPMVFDVCRKVLRDSHDAEDAFQATFLVLAARARSIRKQSSVGSWLHGVALRVARRARVDAAKRTAQERRIAEMTKERVGAEARHRRICRHRSVARRDCTAAAEIPRAGRPVLPRRHGAGNGGTAAWVSCWDDRRPPDAARERLKARLSRAESVERTPWFSRAFRLIRFHRPCRDRLSAQQWPARPDSHMAGAPLAAGKLAKGVMWSMSVIKLVKVGIVVPLVLAAVGSSGGWLLRPRAVASAAQQINQTQVQKPPAFWIGQKVVTIDFAPLRDGDRIFDDGEEFRVYTVDRIDGSRLRLRFERVMGWVRPRSGRLA